VTHNQNLQKIGLNTAKVSNLIVKAFKQSSPDHVSAGKEWFTKGQNHCSIISDIAGISTEHSAAVISALSPRTTWKRNVMGAYHLVVTGEAPYCMSANVKRAKIALNSPDPISTLKGNKTNRFAKNLAGDYDWATIDVWMLRALGMNDKMLDRAGVYEAIEYCFKLASKRLGVEPAIIQATIWCSIRGKAV
jgi:hypothetical protein